MFWSVLRGGDIYDYSRGASWEQSSPGGGPPGNHSQAVSFPGEVGLESAARHLVFHISRNPFGRLWGGQVIIHLASYQEVVENCRVE
jgi:hypothetical protein